MKWKAAGIGMMLTLMAAMPIVGAVDAPVDMKADSIEYDSKKGVLRANGHVVIVQGTAKVQGAHAVYNMKKKEGTVSGGVVMHQEGATLKANQVNIANETVFTATGNVDLTKENNRLTGPRLVYYTDKEFAVADGNARLVTADGTLTAPRIEASMPKEEAVATGGVQINSQTHNLTATSDTAYYYGEKTGQNKLVLKGNAHAVQDGNQLKGSELTILLDDNELQSRGGSHLVIKDTNGTKDANS